MGVLGRVLATSAPGAADDYWYQPKGMASVAGVPVTADTALTLPAFYAGVTAIAETVATTPFDMYERVTVQGEPGKRSADNHPLDYVIHSQPNAIQSAVDYWEWKVAIAILRGRAVSEIVPGQRGAVDQLIPLHPDLVMPKRNGDERVWEYRDPKQNFQARTLMGDEVFVLRGRLGVGLLEYARDSIGISLAMQRHQGQLFSRGARHQGVIKHPGKLSPAARVELQKEIDKFTINGQFSGRPMLLEDGMEWMNAGFSDRESQLADLLRMSVLDAARWLRIQPTKLQELGDATFTNVEHLGIEFVTDTIRPWCVRIEQATNRDLVVASQRFFAEHNLEGLLRGDIATRYAAYAIAIQWGWMTPNEVRARENLNPIPGGDRAMRPLNMTTDQGAKATGYLRLMARDQAARATRKETAAIAKLAEHRGEAWTDGVRAFYDEHAEFVARLLRLEGDTAEAYARGQAAKVLAGGHLDDELDRTEDLTSLALATVADLQVVTTAAGGPTSPPAPDLLAFLQDRAAHPPASFVKGTAR